MKPSRLFWGTLFIALGTLFLLGEILGIDVNCSAIGKFWPLVLVLIGLALMFRQLLVRNVLAAMAGLALAWLLYGFASFAWLDTTHSDDWGNESGEALVQEFTEPMPAGLERATLTFDAAVGKFNLDTVSGYVIAAKFKTNLGRYVFDRRLAESAMKFVLKPEGFAHFEPWAGEQSVNVGEIRLNPLPRWDMQFDVGAASVEFDLSPFKVEHLSIEAGAANVRLFLGAPEREMRCNIKTGVSTVRVSVPESVGCEIRMNGGLSSKRFVGFEKVSDRLYRTDNFEQAARKIFIDAEAGLSTFHVKRY